MVEVAEGEDEVEGSSGGKEKEGLYPSNAASCSETITVSGNADVCEGSVADGGREMSMLVTQGMGIVRGSGMSWGWPGGEGCEGRWKNVLECGMD